jgi:tetratricopeptide (TPR) repeat protein
MRNKVFIGYSPKDNKFLEELIAHLSPLERAGHVKAWSDKQIQPGAKWLDKIEEEIASAGVAVLLVTKDFLASDFIHEQELGPLLAQAQRGGVRILWVPVRACAYEETPLKLYQPVIDPDKPLAEMRPAERDKAWVTICGEIKRAIEPPSRSSESADVTPVGAKVDTSYLPTLNHVLVDRNACLERLTRALRDPRCFLFSIVAMGGTGKTAVVNHWLEGLKNDPAQEWAGLDAVFAWSFYNQGVTDRYVSSEPFFRHAFEFFTGSEPGAGLPRDMGRRLANVLRQRRALLVLDGLEPLQEPPGSGARTGHMMDQGIRSLLYELATGHPGLCVITTRLPVADLNRFHATNCIEVDLEQLAASDGARLLRQTLAPRHASPKQKNIAETTKEEDVQKISREFGGHALALCLLGNYLAIRCGSDIRRYNEVPLLAEKTEGPYARTIMRAYEQWFAGTVELDVLHLLSLFDRPAELDALTELRRAPTISGLTERLQDRGSWNEALMTLRMVGLLLDEPDGALDCHPLVREYFNERFRATNPQAWQMSHGRLYAYFCGVSPTYPNTLAAMEPLFRAVAHGCKAGRHAEALHEVYIKRIQRGGESFGMNMLGMFSSCLTALAGFFEAPWNKRKDGLGDADFIYVLFDAAWAFWSIGPLDQAAELYDTTFSVGMAIDDLETASGAAYCAAVTKASLGKIGAATRSIRQALKLARRSGALQEVENCARALGGILFLAGRIPRAERCFRLAEAIQRTYEPRHRWLNGVYGADYCELLSASGRYREARARAMELLTYPMEPPRVVCTALYHLAIVRSYCREEVAEGVAAFGEAAGHMTKAIELLRAGNDVEFLGVGLLVDAELRRMTGAIAEAQRSIREACAIAVQGNWVLLIVDCHIEMAFLRLEERRMGLDERWTAGCEFDLQAPMSARQHYERAVGLSDQIGYRRRDPELERLRKELAEQPG